VGTCRAAIYKEKIYGTRINRSIIYTGIIVKRCPWADVENQKIPNMTVSPQARDRSKIMTRALCRNISLSGKTNCEQTGPFINHSSPSINIFLSGKTSKISHSNPSTSNLYFLHSCPVPVRSVHLFDPIPTSTSSNLGVRPISMNTCPIAYFSWRNNRAQSADVIRTVEVAVQTI
jgi:hypothetical protein